LFFCLLELLFLGIFKFAFVFSERERERERERETGTWRGPGRSWGKGNII
jgi:hypothetical protein